MTSKAAFKKTIISGIALLSLIFPSPDLGWPKEGTAFISLEKPDPPGSVSKLYRVQPGDTISGILQRELGRTRFWYQAVKTLNPTLKDLNRIYPGQTIALPRDKADAPPAPSPRTPEIYTVKKGDTLSGIISQGGRPARGELRRRLEEIREQNPQITDLNRIHEGQRIILPPREGTGASSPASQAQAARETAPQKQGNLLETLKIVLSRSGVNLDTTGKHYFPLPGIGVFQLDATVIPVVEFPQGSVILLDFSSRIPREARGALEDTWKNISCLTPEATGNLASFLEQLFAPSKNHRVGKPSSPLVLSDVPQVTISPDIVITSLSEKGTVSSRQGIFFLKGNSPPLPGSLRSFSEGKGLIITEIREGRIAAGQVSRPGGPSSARLNSSTQKDLIYDLVRLLGLKVFRDKEIPLFDQARDGFHLSFSADLVIAGGATGQRIIHTRPLPGQFVSLLKERGIPVLIVSEKETRKEIVEKTLGLLDLPHESGNFTFSAPKDSGGPAFVITFAGIKVNLSGEVFYLTDSDPPFEMESVLPPPGRARIINY